MEDTELFEDIIKFTSLMNNITETISFQQPLTEEQRRVVKALKEVFPEFEKKLEEITIQEELEKYNPECDTEEWHKKTVICMESYLKDYSNSMTHRLVAPAVEDDTSYDSSDSSTDSELDSFPGFEVSIGTGGACALDSSNSVDWTSLSTLSETK